MNSALHLIFMKILYYIPILVSVLISHGVSAQEIDSTFGINGFLPYGGTFSNSELNKGIGYNSAVQPDGKIVVTIDKADLNGQTDLFFYTYRYNSDGTPDDTFGLNGVSKIFTGDRSRGYDIALQPDGKILVAGETEYCVNGICGAPQLIVFRLKPNGDADSTFGEHGKVITSDIFGTTGTFAISYRLNLQSDGKILVGGKGIGAKPFIARLNTDGSADLTFAQNGVHTENIAYSQTLDLKMDGLGNSYALVEVFNYIGSVGDTLNPEDILIIKLNASGQPDASFGANGRLLLDFGLHENPVSLFPMDDQSIALVGSNWFTRILPNGTISPDFPANFKELSVPNSEPVTVKKVIALSDTRFLLCGSLYPKVNGNYREKGLLMMVDKFGNKDTSFNDAGFQIFDYGMIGSTGWQGKFAVFYDVDLLPDGTLYATGKRNPTVGHTMASLFLLKMTGVIIGTGSLNSSELSIEKLKSIAVYPNPAKNQLHVSNLSENETLEFSIFSLNGELVKKHQPDFHSSTETIEIDELVSGIYFLKCESKTVNQYIRFVKL